MLNRRAFLAGLFALPMAAQEPQSAPGQMPDGPIKITIDPKDRPLFDAYEELRGLLHLDEWELDIHRHFINPTRRTREDYLYTKIQVWRK